MEIYLARKKKVPGHYNPNSYRIFDREVTDDSLGDTRMNKAHIQQKKSPPPPHPREPERRNCPHPWHSRFLRHNVRVLNEPICTMATTDTDNEQNDWWPSRTSDEPLKQPIHSNDTTQRKDFVDHGVQKPNSRHASNPLVIPATGILPVTTPKTAAEPGDVLLEKISYKHDYNCRSDPSEPIRGKLHGSFVWDNVIKDPAGKQTVATPWTKRDIVKSGTVAVVNKENTPTASSPDPASSKTIPSIDGLPPPPEPV